jgi:hypothetical protein
MGMSKRMWEYVEIPHKDVHLGMLPFYLIFGKGV